MTNKTASELLFADPMLTNNQKRIVDLSFTDPVVHQLLQVYNYRPGTYASFEDFLVALVEACIASKDATQKAFADHLIHAPRPWVIPKDQFIS